MTKNPLIFSSLLFLVATPALTPVMAESGSGQGTVTYVPVAVESMQDASGRTIARNHMKGVILATDSSVSFHLATQDCRGTSVVAADGKDVVVKGYCDAIDRDGDVWWLWYDGTTQGSSWGILGGTGKYAGMTGGGTTKNEKPAPDGRFVIHWEGNWQTP